MEDDKENGFSLPLMQSKIDVQNQIITLMQTEIEMQNEKIQSQDVRIKDLSTMLDTLQKQVNGLISQKAEPAGKEKQSAEVTEEKQEAVATKEPPSQADPTITNADVSSVADMARQTAESIALTSGFVYDENSGLYFDYSTGYYYDPNRKLYYNGHTRTYYSYDEVTKEYTFHSQLPPEPGTHLDKASRKKTKVLKHRATQTIVNPQTTLDEASVTKKAQKNIDDDIEEGELSSSSNDSDHSVSIIERPPKQHEVVDLPSDSEDDIEISEKENPPCIRAMVQASQSTCPKLQKGYLFMVTCMGGTIGREGDHHTIIIPDPKVSKDHAQITYSYDEVTALDESTEGSKSVRLEKKYFITDLGSENGTFLNRQRLSPSNSKSEAFEIQHGSVLQIMDTILLLHIHSGTKTCGHCEPGLVLEKEVIILNEPIVTRTQLESQRKKAVRKMRRKYCIGNLQTGVIPKLIEKYKDRAEDRRRLLGSDHPAFKLPEVEPASIHVPINQQNKGFKMLQKMGWSEGESLGQNVESGVREPVKFEVKLNRAGLGSSGSNKFSNYPQQLPPSHIFGRRSKKAAFRKKTAQRYFAAAQNSSTTTTQDSIPTGKTSFVSSETNGFLDVIQLD